MVQAGDICADTVVRHDPRAEFRELAGEGGVLLHLDTADYYGVNAVGALIWELADEVTFADLLAQLRSRLEEVPETFEDEIRAFLADMHSRSLLQLHPGSAPSGTGG